jgi:zinc protease
MKSNAWSWPRSVALVLALACVLPSPTSAGEVEVYDGFFPYEVHRKTLDNGLDVLVIPMPEFKNVLSYNTLVLAGARNEVEPGKTGLAHLFEHILFRHQWEGKTNGYDEAVNQMGAFNNAYTWFDITYYHPTTFTENLDELSRLEADRFANLTITEKIFQTEAGAVLGEYRNNATDPGLRLSETYLRLMYGDYGYGHTALGYLEDVKDMPNEYAAAVQFYENYYRPNNCVLLVTGDVKPDEIFTLAADRYTDWVPRETPALDGPPPVGGPKREHVDWPTDASPRVAVCYRMPAYRTGAVATAVGELLPELLTGDTAPLYQTLRSEKQTCSSLNLGSAQYESFGPGPFVLQATLFKQKYEEAGDALLDEVIGDIGTALEDLKSFSSRDDAQEVLDALKSKYQYDVLAQVDSPASAAETFYWFYRFERDLQVFDKLVDSVQALTPGDIDSFAQQTFVPENQVIVTLTHAEGADEGAR